MLDIDKQPCPDFFDIRERPHEAVKWILDMLPALFQDTTCYYKFSSSQDVSPKVKGENTISIHLWFWLDREITDGEWKRYLRSEKAPVDLTLFNPVQIHYIAKPIFENMDDPLPKRSGIFEGTRQSVDVPEIPEPPVSKATPRAAHKVVIGEEDWDEAIEFFIPYYKEGIRNTLSATIAATLYRGGWDQQRVVDFVHELADRCSDKEAEERAKNVFRICDRVDQNLPAQGIPTLKNELGIKDVDAVLLLLGLKERDLESTVSRLSNKSSHDEIKTVLNTLIDLPAGELEFYLGKIIAGTKITKKTLQALLNEVRQEQPTYQPTDWPDKIVNGYLHAYYQGGKHLLRSSDKQYWRYNGRYWEIVPEDYIKKGIINYARDIKAELKLSGSLSKMVTEALNILEGETYEARNPLRVVSKDMPLVINCRNGEAWFEDNADISFRPHRAEGYLRHCLKVNYDPASSCPQFDRMVQDIFSNSVDAEDMRRHFMEFAGYICQPWRKIPVIALLHGGGANGKSTLIGLLCRVLGDDAVLAGRINEVEGDKFKIGALDGKLMFYEDDVGMNTRLDDGFLKTIGEEKLLTGEHKFKPSFSFTTRAVPVMLANDYPLISDLSHGLARRLLVFPFNRKFEEKEQEKGIADRIWNEEAPGILNQLIQGFQRLKRRGRFLEPQDCITAKNVWITRSNILPSFIEDCCRMGEKLGQPLKEFYERFEEYCHQTGNRPVPRQQWVRSRLESLGYEISVLNGQPHIRGIVAGSSVFGPHS
jgi:P4 family phage/plasmid primase-like protien